MNNGVVRDRDNNFSRHQTFKDGVTIEGGLTVDITGGSNAEETADFTAEAGKVYIVDTSSAAITATLPASPAALEEVTFMDGAKTFNSNALTVNMNGKKLDGATVSTKVHTTKGGAFKYIYRNATYGWLLKAFIFMLFALNVHAGDFAYEMNSWEQDSGLSIGTDKLKPRTAGGLLSIADSAGTTVATITTSAMTITTASITGLTSTTGSIGTLDVSTSQIGTLSLTTALTVSNGGTGLSTLAAGRIPYGAVTSAFGNSADFTYDGNKLEIIDDSGAQLRLTDSTGNYTDFRTDSAGNLTIEARQGVGIRKSGQNTLGGTKNSFTTAFVHVNGDSAQKVVTFTLPNARVAAMIAVRYFLSRPPYDNPGRSQVGYVYFYAARDVNADVVLDRLDTISGWEMTTTLGGVKSMPDTQQWSISRSGAEASNAPQGVQILLDTKYAVGERGFGYCFVEFMGISTYSISDYGVNFDHPGT